MSWADELHAEILACLERDARAKMQAVHILLEDESPKDTVNFAASWRPWIGERPEDVQPEEHTDLGEVAEASIFEAWEFGQPAGESNTHPASVRLWAGASDSARQGWIDAILKTVFNR